MAAPRRARAASLAGVAVAVALGSVGCGNGAERGEALAANACALFASAEPAKRSSVEVSASAADLAATASTLDRRWADLARALGLVSRFNQMTVRWATEDDTVPQLNPSVMAAQLRWRGVIDAECARLG